MKNTVPINFEHWLDNSSYSFWVEGQTTLDEITGEVSFQGNAYLDLMSASLPQGLIIKHPIANPKLHIMKSSIFHDSIVQRILSDPDLYFDAEEAESSLAA